jgi:chromosome segregation ATPase
MIDHLDKETLPLTLHLEQKRGRGRPATGKALSNAERQRLYRERKKEQRNEKTEIGLKGAIENWEEACRNLGKASGRIKELEAELATLKGDLAIANAKLAQRNENTKRHKRHRDEPAKELPELDDRTYTLQARTGSGKWMNLVSGIYGTEASRQLDRVIDNKIMGQAKNRQYRLVQD